MTNATILWYANTILGSDIAPDKIYSQLETEIPNSISAVMDRSCNLQCRHCEFKREKSSEQESTNVDLSSVIINMVRQLPKKDETLRQSPPFFVHAGRILQQWNIDMMGNLRIIRPDIKIGIIDNGTYQDHNEYLEEKRFKFDWIDISIDGLEKSHNLQRDPKNGESFKLAIDGLVHARKCVQGNTATVNANMTITKLNYADVLGTSDYIFQNNLADTIHYSFMTPVRQTHTYISINKTEYVKTMLQINKAQQKYGTDKVFFRIFRLEDMQTLANIVGNNSFKKSIRDENARIYHGLIKWNIGKIQVIYYPLSIWPNETIIIDSDGSQRIPMFQQYSLQNLAKDLTLQKYTVDKLNKESSLEEQYSKEVNHWKNNFGLEYLKREKEFFSSV